jgi:Family of unknown function (DUF6424)
MSRCGWEKGGVMGRRRTAAVRTRVPSGSAEDPAQPHTYKEDYPWIENIPGHPPRSDSNEYRHSRDLMNEKAKSVQGLFYGPSPYEDHHGGGLWLKDADGWFLVRNVAGMEWSAQFCSDPKKVDQLRVNAKRLYTEFPQAAKELGIQDLLDTPITDADGVARWCDSICNASVPLPTEEHTGTLPGVAGVHHYPTPVTDIQFFKYDDFNLWVTDEEGNRVAVTPFNPRGSGDGRVMVVYAGRRSPLRQKLVRAARLRRPVVLAPDHPVAKKAFREQYRKLRAKRR